MEIAPLSGPSLTREESLWMRSRKVIEFAEDMKTMFINKMEELADWDAGPDTGTLLVWGSNPIGLMGGRGKISAQLLTQGPS